MADKITDKQALQEWGDYIENLRRTTNIILNETDAEKHKRISKLEADPEEWFKYYFPNDYRAEAAPFQKAASKRVINNPEWYEVRMWSRELAKSTRTMMEVLYLCLTGKKRFVLLVSSSYENAERLLMPYRANLEANEKIKNDYGIQQKPGLWTSGEFSTLSGTVFLAKGIGGTPRGVKSDNSYRPDVILFDDTDTDQDCRNPEIIKANWKWIEDAAIGTRSVDVPTLIIFCGNRIAVDCCVQRATQFCDYHDEVNIRDKDGYSTWPQKNSEESIDRVLSQKSYASQQKEYYNNPITEGSVFKDMAYKRMPSISHYPLLVCYTDPSFKDSKKNDYKATVLVGKYKDEFHVLKCYLEQTSTDKMIDWHYTIFDMSNGQRVYYLMEQVFLSEILIKEFYNASKKRRATIPIKGDDRKKPDKFTRIETLLEPLNRNGKLYLNEAEKDNPHMKRLEEQFLAIAPGSRAHDDGPDAVEGAIWYLNQKAGAIDKENVHYGKGIRNNKRF